MLHVMVTVLTVSSAIAVGMVMALLGNLKLALARRPEQDESRIRHLLILLNLSFIPLMILAGVLVDRFGVRSMMICGSVVLSLAFLALSAGADYSRTLFAVVTAAFGAGCLHVATMVQLPLGIFGVSEVAASLQMGLVFVALGGLIAPPLLDILLETIGFQRTMAALALLFLLPAFLAAATQGDDAFPALHGLSRLEAMLLDPNILMAGLVFAVYAPLEAFISVWTATYLENIHQSRFQSSWLALFWSAVVMSRLLWAVVLHAFDLRNSYMAPFLVVPAITSAIILGNMTGTTRVLYARIGLFLLGFFLGPLFPMLLGTLFTRHEVDGLHGTAYATLFAFGSIGSLALSPLVHHSVNQRRLSLALRIPLLIALALSATTLMFALLPRD